MSPAALPLSFLIESGLIVQDKLERWEKWPIAAIVSAQGLQVARWYSTNMLPDAAAIAIPWLTVIAAIAAAAAIDGALIATVMAVRMGRVGKWSIATIVVSAAFGGAVALDLHQAIVGWGPWLHAGFALTIVAYLMHLTQPRADVVATLAALEQRLSRREQDLNSREMRLSNAEQEMSRREQELEQARNQVVTVHEEVVQVATVKLTWPMFESLVKQLIENRISSRSSLRRVIEQAVNGDEQE